jgi:4-hydroxybenzoate polyprenyltransferase
MESAYKSKIWSQVRVYGQMIKFSHTVFALPFALAAVILAQRYHRLQMTDLLWIVLAMVGARSAAMGFNRLADAHLDAQNPRTAGREIPSGKISPMAVKLFILLSALVFIWAAAMLGSICLYLSFVVLALLFLYSYLKRFTWLCHLYLGFVISLAPLGAWIALTQSVDWPILWLSMALLTYITGFDILYACQDVQFDQQAGLFSIPARYGIKRALALAKIIHLLSFLSFAMIYVVFDMKAPYLVAVGIIGILLVIEHRLVNPDDLSKVPFAFFHVNSIISITLFVGVLADELFQRWT